jgi:hypothetical protein
MFDKSARCPQNQWTACPWFRNTSFVPFQRTLPKKTGALRSRTLAAKVRSSARASA